MLIDQFFDHDQFRVGSTNYPAKVMLIKDHDQPVAELVNLLGVGQYDSKFGHRKASPHGPTPVLLASISEKFKAQPIRK